MRTENFLWIGKNFIRMILLLAAVSVVTFTLVSISPIDPLQANVGQTALGSMSEEQIEKLQSYWGVDTPPLERYLNWAKDFVRGDMGIMEQMTMEIRIIMNPEMTCSHHFF